MAERPKFTGGWKLVRGQWMRPYMVSSRLNPHPTSGNGMTPTNAYISNVTTVGWVTHIQWLIGPAV